MGNRTYIIRVKRSNGETEILRFPDVSDAFNKFGYLAAVCQAVELWRVNFCDQDIILNRIGYFNTDGTDMLPMNWENEPC